MSKPNPAKAGSNEIKNSNDRKDFFGISSFVIDLTFGF